MVDILQTLQFFYFFYSSLGLLYAFLLPHPFLSDAHVPNVLVSFLSHLNRSKSSSLLLYPVNEGKTYLQFNVNIKTNKIQSISIDNKPLNSTSSNANDLIFQQKHGIFILTLFEAGSLHIWGGWFLSFFGPKKVIFEGGQKSPRHLMYIFDLATNRVKQSLLPPRYVVWLTLSNCIKRQQRI